MTARSMPLHRTNGTQAGVIFFSALEATSHQYTRWMYIVTLIRAPLRANENFVGTIKLKQCSRQVKRSQQSYITQPDYNSSKTGPPRKINAASRVIFRSFILLTHLTGFLWRGEHRRYHLKDAVQSNIKPCDTNHNLPHFKPQGRHGQVRWYCDVTTEKQAWQR